MKTLVFTILALFTLTAHAASTKDVWVKSGKTMNDYLKQGYTLVGFDVDRGNDFADGQVMRYVLQHFKGNQTLVAMCTERGNKHQCWVTK